MRSVQILAFFAVLSGVFLAGCRKAKIDAPTVPLEPTVSVGTLPESRHSGKDSAWYQGLMPTAPSESKTDKGKKDKDAKEPSKDRPWAPIETNVEPIKVPPPSEKEPPAAPPTTAASARADAQVLVDELRERIESERDKDAPWNLLRLELQTVSTEKGKVLAVVADVGLQSLYAVRPEILFEQLRFEDCMNRLARMSGMCYAQRDRLGNPLVTWRGENVSVYDAVQAITARHGFAARFAGAGTRFTFPLAKQPTREKFIEEVTGAIREHGKSMQRDMPTLIISSAPKASVSEAGGHETKRSAHAPKEPPGEPTKEAP